MSDGERGEGQPPEVTRPAPGVDQAGRGGPGRWGPTPDPSPAHETPGGTGTRDSRHWDDAGSVSQKPLSSSSQDPASYYGQPIIKVPVWEPEIAVYLFTGGLAGASGVLAALAEATGRPLLARRAWLGALIGVGISPVVLIDDLGRPERFLNMMRVFKVTSPMNMGVWILSGASTAIGLGAVRSWLGWFPRLGVAGPLGALVFGPPLCTYTAVLFADTAVPVWHEARRSLPWLFAASATASAGAFAAAASPVAAAGPARRMAVAGALGEVAASYGMERGLGSLLAEPYGKGRPEKLTRAARVLNLAGAGLLATAGRSRRGAAVAGGAMVLGAALCTRFAVFEAGLESARDPRYTVIPQRRRLEERRGHRQAEQPARA